jgi:hypothetical protein
VELAYQTVESSLDAFQAPPAPVGAAGAGDSGVRAASLTQQLLNAQNSLLRAQNQLLTVWVTYLTTRMQLYRDLELMPLDARGVWIDEYGSGSLDPSQSSASPSADGSERAEPISAPRELAAPQSPAP